MDYKKLTKEQEQLQASYARKVAEQKLARDQRLIEAAYAKKLKGREANVAKNFAENKQLGITAATKPINFPTKDTAESLGDIRNKMLEKGNVVSNIANEVKTAEGAEPRLLSLATRFPKLKAMLALAGPAAVAAGAFGIGNKAMAGDIKGAAGDTADMATDYMPGIGEAKMALSSAPLGEHSDEVNGEKPFDFSKYKTPVEAAPQEAPARFKDLTQTLGDAMDQEKRRGKVKMQQNY
ncbi:MAG: hypothetical protein ACOYOV_00370 [Bacteroidales bacterium]